MQNEKSQKINKRFFEAIDALIAQKKLRGKKTFATLYDINWGALYRLRNEPEREFQLSFLTIIVTDFGVSADWLLTGRGKMFKE